MNPNTLINLFEENGPLRNSVTQIGLLDKIDNGTLTDEQVKKLMTTAVTQVNLLEDKEGNNSEFDPENPETFDVFEDDELVIDEFEESAGNGEEEPITHEDIPSGPTRGGSDLLKSGNPEVDEDPEEEFPEVDEDPEEESEK